MIAERLPQLLDTLGLADVQPILDTHLERVAKGEMTEAEALAKWETIEQGEQKPASSAAAK